MAVLVTMPKMSETTEEVTLLRWKVRVGDRVERGDALCEVETDKTTMDVESFEAGTVLELRAAEAQAVAAGSVIAVLGFPGESPPASAPERSIRATPLVRGIARKRGVDLSRVRGTGAAGLITKRDLEAHLSGSAADGGGDQAPPPTDPQRIVGRNLSRWWSTTPHFYLRLTVIMDRLLEFRRTLRRPDGGLLSLNAFLMHAVARSLARHPRVNSGFREESLVLHEAVNVGVAVASGRELYVPVVRQADRLSLHELDKEITRLAAKAREGGLQAADVADGTFTLTNLGMYGIDEFSPVIAPGQAGIAAVGRVHRSLEIGEGDAMSIRSVCVLTAAFDHRVVNGAEAAEFLVSVRRLIEGQTEGGDG